MKFRFPIAALGVLLLGACAPITATQLPEVGPQATRSQGVLIVNSATWEHNDGDVKFYPHKEYSLYAKDGRFLRCVRNHLGHRDETAEEVCLPPGRYFVIADSETDGLVKVPVLIVNGRRTVVELERPRRS